MITSQILKNLTNFKNKMNSTRKIRAELSVSIAPSQPLYDYLTPVRLQVKTKIRNIQD